MDKKLIWKFLLIVGLLAVSVFSIFDPFRGFEMELKPGIDLAGGTSLLYEIDTEGLDNADKRQLAQNMIRILRKRVDPTGTSNMVWRAHGTDRIEIQMPLATEKTREIRRAYREALEKLESYNVNEWKVRQALLDQTNRNDLFDQIVAAHPGSGEQLRTLLERLAQTNDELEAARNRRETAIAQESLAHDKLTELDVRPPSLSLVRTWENMDDPNQIIRMEQAQADTPEKQELFRNYVAARNELTVARNALEELETQNDQAWADLHQGNIDINWLTKILDAAPDKRQEAIDHLREQYPDRTADIDALVAAYEKRREVIGQLDDPEDLMRKLRGSGVLEFRILPTTDDRSLTEGEIRQYMDKLDQYGPGSRSGDENYVWQEIRDFENFKVGRAIVHEFAGTMYLLCSNKEDEVMLHERGINAWRLAQALPSRDDLGLPAVQFELNEIGAKKFHALTRQNKNRPLCILLDGVAYSAPNIQDAIFKRGIIHGHFTIEEVTNLVDTLNAGSLPARLGDQPISVQTVGPTLGQDNLNAGMSAALWGLGTVAVFMVIYYLAPGIIATIALFMNLVFILAVMAFSKSTFTMPGIAGLILTIGMSVDANVLIFERIREEQQRGSSLRMAIRNGYGRALSTIMDANITTFIVALILRMVASEDVKGFAVVLMIGIVTSIFCALFVTRAVFDLLTSARIMKNKAAMLQLIRSVNINWMNAKFLYWTVSGLAVVGCLFLFISRDNSKYSIEFIGGTSVVVELNEEAQQAGMDRQAVEDAIASSGAQLGALGVQSIGSEGNQFEVTTTTTNELIARIVPPPDAQTSVEAIQTGVIAYAHDLGDSRLEQTTVTAGENPGTFHLETVQVNRNRVADAIRTTVPDARIETEIKNTVNDAVLKALQGKLKVQENLEPTIQESAAITSDFVAGRPYLDKYLGHLWMSVRFGESKTDTLERLRIRFDQTRFSSEFEQYGPADIKVFPPDNVDQDRAGHIELVIQTPDAFYDGENLEGWEAHVATEKQRVIAALERTRSLPRVTQIDPTIGRESFFDALVAIILSLVAIIIYVWVRFGNIRFGVAAVVALIHDVSIALGLVAASVWLADTAVGRALLIGDFKIDLPMIAALLTLIGYSLNDTIVVFDRIRENRGKQPILTRDIINNSINQTLSRTLLTSGTTLIVVAIMYVLGGEGLRGFNYALIIGIIVGTYSSIAVASPLLFGAKDEKSMAKPQATATGKMQTQKGSGKGNSLPAASAKT